MSTAKKVKVASDAQYLEPEVLSSPFAKKLKSEIAASKPYHYGVIHKLFNDEVLRAARTEIFENIQFTDKETDIYKLVQTGDLLNLDGLPKDELGRLQSLLKVRNALYSQEFRDVISEVTGCGPLSGKRFDLSLNNYNKGCHLLTHDDVIGTRVISFILYLLPPDLKWDPKWGGALQLYNTVSEGIPENDHCAAVPPQWNQLSFFKIIPGHSFHDVEEVYVDQPRLSIQGWFHAPQEDEPEYQPAKEDGHREKSTLSQLSQAHNTNDGYIPERKFADFGPDMDLKRYISPEVLEDTEKYQEVFADLSILHIKNFLHYDFWAKVKSEVEQLELAKCPQFTKDVSDAWGVASPAHLRRYCYLNNDQTDHPALGELKQLLRSKSFANLLQKLTSLNPKSEYVELRRFRPGRDFTLASVSGVRDNIIEAMLSITTAKWDDGHGGYDLVMGGGYDENDDPAVYKAASEDEDGVLLSKLPTQNELTLILRDEDLLRFVKYVSKNARGSRFDVFGQYEVEHSGETEAEDNDE